MYENYKHDGIPGGGGCGVGADGGIFEGAVAATSAFGLEKAKAPEFHPALDFKNIFQASPVHDAERLRRGQQAVVLRLGDGVVLEVELVGVVDRVRVGGHGHE